MSFPLLAESFREKLGQGFRHEGYNVQASEVAWVFIGLFASIAFVVLIDRAAKWRDAWLARPNPNRLYRDLCRTHQLNRRERRLLAKLAAAYCPAQPATCFVWPEGFQRAALDPHFAGQSAALQSLWNKLGPAANETAPLSISNGLDSSPTRTESATDHSREASYLVTSQ